MNLLEEIKKYKPLNEQEKKDKEQMIEYMKNNDNYLSRENKLAHFTASIWTVNKERTKVLMVYHKIYDSWSWIGGHADGIEDLRKVALRELEEETGVKYARLVSDDILSLETLNVNGHIRRGEYVPSHLHFNITYLAEADEKEKLMINEMENKGVQWFTFEDALKVSHEPWFVEMIYKKLIQRSK
ncbi:MAG: NUDIX hydrolase [Roseburia sp.]|nr:NUDIX hydrolase [Anaeroplasma bactoclasticum]MCM1196913.1 NUDIX hydrolase [Roseburia sp.]MCM1556470.1 NUDIX hydrolase [Anaeroplasma bactoclasticum]